MLEVEAVLLIQRHQEELAALVVAAMVEPERLALLAQQILAEEEVVAGKIRLELI
jgi:hypothetical protein